MYSYRVAISLIGALVVTVVGRIALVWDRLPYLMASHFGISGTPNAWMPRGQFFSFIAAVGGGTILLFATARLWLRIIPAQLVNIPNRDYWMAPDRRVASVDRMGTWMAWFGVGMTAFLAFVVELALRANLERSRLANRPLLFALVTYALVVILSIAKLYREFQIPRDRSSKV
jgi:uncharacterized membrane protein